MKEELSKEEEELAEMVAINDDDIYPLSGKRSIDQDGDGDGDGDIDDSFQRYSSILMSIPYQHISKNQDGQMHLA